MHNGLIIHTFFNRHLSIVLEMRVAKERKKESHQEIIVNCILLSNIQGVIVIHIHISIDKTSVV